MKIIEFRSKHPGDVYNWIIKVLESCETIKQLRNARKLIWNYEKIYGESMTRNLLTKFDSCEINILSS